MASQHTTVKAFTMASIANNPKLARQISEGLSAPLGSTKRTQAKELLKVIKKMTGIKFPGMQDGQGGAPTDLKTGAMNPVERNSFTNTRIFPAAPEFSDAFKNQGKKYKEPSSAYTGGKEDGQGGPINEYPSFGTASTLSSSPSSLERWMNPGSFTNNYIPEEGFVGKGLHAWDDATMWAGNKLRQGIGAYGDIAKATGYGLAGAAQYGMSNAFSDSGTPYGDTWGAKKQVDIYNKYFPNVTTPSGTGAQLSTPPNNRDSLIKSTNLNFPVASAKVPNPGDFAWLDTKDAKGRRQYAYRNPNGTLKIGYENDNPGFTPFDANGKPTTQYGPKDEHDGSSAGTKDADLTGYQTDSDAQYAKLLANVPASVRNAVNAQIGSTAFAMNMLGNRAAMKELFKGVPEDQIPYGLAQQYQDLQKVLNKENQLDQLLNQQANVRAGKNVFIDNINDYIRGKDTYIDDINKMIEKTKSNLYDPTTSGRAEKRANAELSYLYALKGRQNKRYVDYLNGAINQEDAYIASVDSRTTNAINRYNNDLTNITAINTDTYNKYFTALQEMYQTMDALPDKLLAREKATGEIKNAALASIKDALGLSKDAKTDLEQRKIYEEALLDKDGNLKYGINPLSEMGLAVNNGYNADGLLETISRGMAASANKATDYKSVKDQLEALKSIKQQFGGTMNTDSAENKVRQAATASLAKQFDATKLASLLSDIKGGWFGGSVSPEKMDDFIKAVKDAGIDESYAEDLYHAWVQSKKDGMSDEAFFKSPYSVADILVSRLVG